MGYSERAAKYEYFPDEHNAGPCCHDCSQGNGCEDEGLPSDWLSNSRSLPFLGGQALSVSDYPDESPTFAKLGPRHSPLSLFDQAFQDERPEAPSLAQSPFQSPYPQAFFDFQETYVPGFSHSERPRLGVDPYAFDIWQPPERYKFSQSPPVPRDLPDGTESLALNFQVPTPPRLLKAFSFTSPDELMLLSSSVNALKEESWYPIGEIQGNPTWGPTAYLGRSVGDLRNPRFYRGCTAWNMGGPFIATNAHCLSDANAGRNSVEFIRENCGLPINIKKYNEKKENLRKYTLGLYGNPPLYRDQGKKDLENRLLDLGIPPDSVKNAIAYQQNKAHHVSMPDQLLTQCRLESTFLHPIDGCLDLAIYRCDSADTISYTVTGLERKWKEEVDLSVHDVAGAIPLEAPPWFLRKSESAYPFSALSVNELPGTEYGEEKKRIPQVLLSPGQIKKTLGNSPLYPNHPMVFEGERILAKPGSSGGAAINTFITNRAFGSYFSGIEPLHIAYMSAFPPRFLNYVSRNKPIQRKLLIPDGAPTPREVLRGPARRVSLNCPMGYAAAGIVASQTNLKEANQAHPDQSFIGNFGLVCLPFSEVYQFDKAVVIAGGSDFLNPHHSPLSREPVNGEPFDLYMATHFQSRPTPPRAVLPGLKGFFQALGQPVPYAVGTMPQQFRMCPPKYFLYGVEFVQEQNAVTNEPVIRGFYMLHCRSSTRRFRAYSQTGGGKRAFVDVVNNLEAQGDQGRPLGSSRPSGVATVKRQCTFSDSYVTGVDLYRSTYTHGFAFRCGTTKTPFGYFPSHRQPTVKP